MSAGTPLGSSQRSSNPSRDWEGNTSQFVILSVSQSIGICGAFSYPSPKKTSSTAIRLAVSFRQKKLHDGAAILWGKHHARPPDKYSIGGEKLVPPLFGQMLRPCHDLVATNMGLVAVFNITPMGSKNLTFAVNFDKSNFANRNSLPKNGYHWTACFLNWKSSTLKIILFFILFLFSGFNSRTAKTTRPTGMKRGMHYDAHWVQWLDVQCLISTKLVSVKTETSNYVTELCLSSDATIDSNHPSSSVAHTQSHLCLVSCDFTPVLYATLAKFEVFFIYLFILIFQAAGPIVNNMVLNFIKTKEIVFRRPCPKRHYHAPTMPWRYWAGWCYK